MAIKSLKGASALALLIGTTGIAYAQQTPTPAPAPAQPNQTVSTTTQPAPQTTPDQTAAAAPQAPEGERVVVVGSLIATLPEDAPKPVEVYTSQDLQQQGTPSVTEFVRSLTLSYGDDLGFGQASPDVPQGSGFGNANMRGLGSNGTLVLMNGQKLAPWNGSFGADINTVPMEALEAVEVLKGGASATYGAGAVGGVINFRTRRDIDAPQITIEKQFYEGSDGYYKVDFLTGWVGDAGNLLISASHSHEDPMLMTERDFSNLPFNINPAPYTLTGSNPGVFQFSNTDRFLAAALPPVAFPGVRDLRNDADCTAIGGSISNVLQPGNNQGGFAVPACAFPQAPFQSLVNENTTSRAYAELNADISDNMEIYFTVNYSNSMTIEQRVPIDPTAVVAINRAGWTGCSTSCNYMVPASVQTYTTAGVGTGTFVRNPFIDDFLTRTASAGLLTNPNGALYMGLNWRPFLFGGNSMFDDRRRHDKFERESIAVNAGTKGQFTEDTWVGPWLNGVNYDFSGQYNQYLFGAFQPDIFAARLQNALMGYGGPHCNAVDRVAMDFTTTGSFNRTMGVQATSAPGTGGCQWFNPFASGFQTSIVNGAANPQFNAGVPVLGPGATPRPTGYANPQDLIDWMWGEGIAEFKLESATFNALLSGAIPESTFALPGGEIGWAAGSEWRQVEGRRLTRDDSTAEQTMNTQDCVWPDQLVTNTPAQAIPSVGQAGCTVRGARYGTGRLNIVAVVPPTYYDNQTIAAFAEFNFPVLDNLNFQYNIRHEEWNGGDLVGDIYTVAGKWDITDNLWIRSDYGTNYRADAALELRPGDQTFSTSGQGRFGTGYTVQQATTVAPDIGPEDDKTFNFGVGWESDLGEGRIRANVNFFEILIDGQVATTSVTTMLNNVFGVNNAACQANRASTAAACVANGGEPVAGLPAATTNGNQYVNCNARLISFVTLGGPCVQGVTQAGLTNNSLVEVAAFQVNGPGFITNGYDFTVDFAYPLWDGTFTAQMTATNNQVYKARGYDVNGVIFDFGGQRLGTANYTRTGNESRRWRGNGLIRWANDEHNISLRANYSSGVFNEAFVVGGLTPIIDNPGVTPDVFSTYGIYPKEYLDFDVNYIYTAPFWEELEFRATVLNIFDKDPSPAQGRSGYYNATGNPRGRIVEIGVTKKF